VIPIGDIPRYQMLIIPPLSILTACELAKVGKFNSRDIKMGILVTLMFITIVFSLNLFSSTQKPLTIEYFDLGIISKNPDIWWGSSSGPLFKVSSYSLFLVTFSSIGLFILYIFSRNAEFKKNILILFVTLSLAFNVFLTGEFLFSMVGPSYTRTMQDMVNYHKENNLPDPLYGGKQFGYYLNKDFGEFYSLFSNEALEKEGGTVMWLNLPPAYEGGPGRASFDKIKTRCTLVKVFYSKNYEAGYIFVCNRTIQKE
jgi:hypothetical protein